MRAIVRPCAAVHHRCRIFGGCLSVEVFADVLLEVPINPAQQAGLGANACVHLPPPALPSFFMLAGLWRSRFFLGGHEAQQASVQFTHIARHFAHAIPDAVIQAHFVIH